ncbi:MAG: glycosyltransferase family 1 protein, partial [Proteobacteria bacterium]|nr:glycosyltransferase family 1 protein [Pseudomonadota bacterium]
MVKGCKNIIIFSTADWNNPFWTNKQHITVQFAKLGYRVLYIE